VLAIVAVVVAGLFARGVLHVGPRTGVDRVRHLVRWPESCAAIDTEPVTRTVRTWWPRAREAKTVTCEMLGPWVMYLRFANAGDERHDLLRHPPESATCLAGREVVIDGLDPGQFARVCREFGGTDVDAVSGLPETAGGVTMDEIDRSVRAEERRDARAELRALRAYWQ
jgi:hypothetical protein